jgi:hypothetical protein
MRRSFTGAEKMEEQLRSHCPSGSTPNFVILLQWQRKLPRRQPPLALAVPFLTAIEPDEPRDDETKFHG